MKQRQFYFVVLFFILSISYARAQQGTALAKIRIDEKGNVEVLQADQKEQNNETKNSPLIKSSELRNPLTGYMPDLTYNNSYCSINYSYPDLTINVTIYNQGIDSAPASTLGLYLVEYGGTGKEQIGSTKIPALNQDDKFVTTIIINISEHIGDWSVCFFVDDLNAVSESNENNNVKTFPDMISVLLLMGSEPDLTYISPSCTYSTNFMNTYLYELTVNTRIINAGQSTAKTNSIGYFLSDDAHITLQDNLIAEEIIPMLQAGNNYNGQTTIDVKNYPGFWWVGFIIDYKNSVNESNELNNVMCFSQPYSRFPDLVARDIIGAGTTGPDIGYRYYIENIGFASTGESFKNYVYLRSTDTSSDYKIDEQQHNTLEGGGVIWSDTYRVTVSGVPEGEYNLRLLVDAEHSIDEISESNNHVLGYTSTILIPPSQPQPDLLVEGIYLIDAEGPDITYRYTIFNRGNAATGTGFKNGIYLSLNNTIDPSDYLIHEHPCSALDAIRTYSSGVLQTTVSGVPTGEYYLGIFTDCDDVIAETYEDNNWGQDNSPRVTIPAAPSSQPDLIVSDVTVSDGSGPVIVYQYTIQNQGSVGIKTNFSNHVYLSQDNTITSFDYRIDEQQCGVLDADAEYSPGALQVTVSGVPAGDYTLGIYTDGENTISESIEDNNTGYDNDPKVIIPQPPATQPDLIVQNVTVTDGSGPEIEYQYTVKNQGNASTGAGFKNHIYLSSDNTITQSDYKIDEQQFSALGSNQERDSGALQAAMGDIPAGDYYLGVYTDAGGSISESVENNNTGYANIMVNMPEIIEEPDSCEGNMITNWSFSNGLQDWQFLWGGAGVSTGWVENGMFHAQITEGGDFPHEVTLHHYGLTIISGNTYIAMFEARADVTRDIRAWVAMSVEPFALYNSNYIFPLTTEWQTFTFTFTMDYPTDPLARLGFDFGATDVDVYLDNVCLALTLPDLIVNDITVTDGSGPTIGYQYTIQNQGEASIGIGFQNLICLSHDNTITLSDYIIDEQPCSALDTGAEFSPGVLLTTVTGLPVGDYYLGVCTDGGDAIFESNENNNTGCAESTVNIPDAFEEPNSCEGNMITNWSFSDGLEDWQFFTFGPGLAISSIENGVFHAQIAEGGDYPHEVTIHHYDLTITNGNTYTATFDARTDSSRDVRVWVAMSEEPWLLYNSDYVFPLTTDWQTFTFTFTMSYPTDHLARFGIDFGTSDTDVYFDNICLVETVISTDIIPEDPPLILSEFDLVQNFPNPFNPFTTIQYAVPKSGFVTLKIYNLLGKEITTLVNERKTPGVYSVQWNGQAMTSAIYFCRLKAGEYIMIKKMILQK
ncbi:CARDB domain-containing protein [bacterium]